MLSVSLAVVATTAVAGALTLAGDGPDGPVRSGTMPETSSGRLAERPSVDRSRTPEPDPGEPTPAAVGPGTATPSERAGAREGRARSRPQPVTDGPGETAAPDETPADQPTAQPTEPTDEPSSSPSPSPSDDGGEDEDGGLLPGLPGPGGG